MWVFEVFFVGRVDAIVSRILLIFYKGKTCEFCDLLFTFKKNINEPAPNATQPSFITLLLLNMIRN